MKLKLNTNALRQMLTFSDLITSQSIAGLVNQNISGLNSGIDVGNGNHAGSFVESLIAGGYAPGAIRGLFLYKGAMPTAAELDTYIAGAPAAVSDATVLRPSDLLVKYIPQTLSTSQGSIISTFISTLATGTGTAAWFAFGVYAYNGYATRPTYLVVGSITGAGGGGDIEMLATNIVSGNAYRVPAYELRLPSKFST